MPRYLRLAGLGGILLAACTPLGPEFREPAPDWLARWQPALYGQALQTDTPAALSQWWLRFDDPTLNTLVETTLRENPGLRIAGLRILESRALQGIASGAQYPQVQQINASAAWARQDHRDGLFDRSGEVRSAEASFDIGWEMDFWGRYRRAVESADAAYFASITAQRDVQVLLAAQVASLYYGYKTTLQRIEIARHNEALQKRSFEITERLYNSGQDSELDLQQARAQYLATRATIPALRQSLTQQRNALCALLGRPPGALPELAEVSSELPQMAALDLDALPAQLLTQRPDVRTAAWQAAAQSAQIGIAEADLYPSLSLVGTLGWSGNSLDSIGDVSTVAGGPALRWNIFNYGRLRNNVRVQDARLEQALENYRNTVLGAAREIDDAASQIANTAESQVILDESVSAAERSLAIATRRYSEGYSEFQRVLDAQAATFAQTDRATVNRGSHVAAVIGLYKALGGGWREADIETLLPQDTRERMQERSDWGELLDAELTPPPEPENTP
ncbi:efflux transporter outer membrane subunit [Parahaliea aestuarii]|uniref:Efflux transporter outer membrane subunit n=1 Tax=Parahaliea aestuarii TaxID=1852021 RepID=A0A5C8ZSH9_9GAMM|nr:efflux transporter outer membrane subunit [Parahaliea aestuarii]TXS91478.1 efflux transporter outer membrane subunit [Parahaliea aestuarii]